MDRTESWNSDPAAEHAEAVTKTAILRAQPEDFHLIETLRFEEGRGPVRLDHHVRRMAASAFYFGFHFRPDLVHEAVDNELLRQPPEAAHARIRITAHRDGHVGVSVEPLSPAAPGPVQLALDPEPIDSHECWPHHKTSRRQAYEVRRGRHQADDVLLVNERGQVTESCIANLAVHLDGRWWTPPLGSGCLPGIGRGVLVASQVLTERSITPDDLVSARGLALVSALRGWREAAMSSHAVAQIRAAFP